jgi:hypothetical protein
MDLLLTSKKNSPNQKLVRSTNNVYFVVAPILSSPEKTATIDVIY